MKKETLEEGFNNHYKNINYTEDSIYKETVKRDFIAGYKLAQERSYSEEEVLELLQDFANDLSDNVVNIKFWFEQFKKK
jgi:hypothetical protein